MKGYTFEEVKHHNTSNDCWLIIKNKVYDVTEFANIHPGGKQLIYSVAGQDATEYFLELHREEILEDIGDKYMIGEVLLAKL